VASQGWISIHRSLFNHWIWTDKEEFDKRSAWIDLLLMVNHEDKKVLINGKLETIKRGQRITSVNKLAERWKWSRKKVTNFLNLLEEDGMIIAKKEQGKYTTITIVNYNFYQDDNTQKEQLKNNRGTTEEQLRNINNNERIMINNDNNDDDEIYILNILERTLNKKISQSSVKKLIKTYGADNIKLLAEKINESTWLKENIDLNKISKKFFNSITEDKYKDYEKKEEVKDDKYDWYKPLDL
jgi:hypothetical protein